MFLSRMIVKTVFGVCQCAHRILCNYKNDEKFMCTTTVGETTAAIHINQTLLSKFMKSMFNKI